jgi:hypothetical protein
MGRNRGGGGGGGGGDTELHAAARSGDMKAVESIVSSNPLAINSRDKHSRTPYPPPFSFLILYLVF